MMRIRIDGGALTSEQLRVDRRHLHDVRPRRRRRHRPAERPAALDPDRGRPGDLGRSSRRSACRPPRPAATRPRVMLGCPLEGVAADSVLDAGAGAARDRREVPRRPGVLQPAAQVQDVHLRLRAALHEPRDQRRLVRRRASVRTARRASTSGSAAGCRPTRCSPSGSACSSSRTRCSEVWAGVTSIFRDYGYRRSRNHARLKFLMADWGPEKFREVLEKEYLGRALPDGPAPDAVARASRPRRRRAAERRPVRDRRGDHSPAARPAPRCAPLAELADRYGNGRVRTHRAAGRRRARRGRTGTLEEPSSTTRRARLRRSAVGVPPRHDRLHRHRVLQAGARRDQGARRGDPRRTRDAAARLRHADHHQRQRLPQLLRPIPGRRHRLQGHGAQAVRTADSEAFQVHLGGQMGTEAEFGRKFRGLKVTADEAPDYVERVLRGYLDRREGGEPFAAYVSRAEEAWLL